MSRRHHGSRSRTPGPCGLEPRCDMDAGGEDFFQLQSALRAVGYSVFVCEAEIRGGNYFLKLIGEAIERCRCFVAVLSPSYGVDEHSPWTLSEAEMAGISHKETRKPRIQLVRHSGEGTLPAPLAVMWEGMNMVPKGRYGTAAEFVARGEAQLVVDELVDSLRADGVHPTSAASAASAGLAATASDEVREGAEEEARP